MVLQCEICGTHISVDMMVVGQSVECPQCKQTVVFSPAKTQASYDVLQPASIQIEATESRIIMSMRWREAGAATESAYIGLFFTGVSLVTGLILPPLGIILGLFTAYIWASYFLNRTAIMIDKAYLTIMTSPLPFIGNPMQRLPLHEVDHLYHLPMRDGAALQTICLLMRDGMKYDVLMAVSEKEAEFIIRVITQNIQPYAVELTNESDSRWYDDALGSDTVIAT